MDKKKPCFTKKEELKPIEDVLREAVSFIEDEGKDSFSSEIEALINEKKNTIFGNVLDQEKNNTGDVAGVAGGGIGGGIAGAAVVPGIVGAAGVPGLSAAGISSGLAALGGTMMGGIAVCGGIVLAGAAVGAAAGYGIAKGVSALIDEIHDSNFKECREKIYFLIYDTEINLYKKMNEEQERASAKRMDCMGMLLSFLENVRNLLAEDMGLRKAEIDKSEQGGEE